jgi:Family of unknown function (DUF6365)
MRLLFSAVCPTGFGETLIGVSLADQLRKMGVTSHFIIQPHALRMLVRSQKDPGHEYTVLEPQMGPLAKLLVDDAVATFRPDAIVLADYLTHCRTFSRRYHLDPWFIESYGLPVIPIDIWELEKTGYRIDLDTGDDSDVNEHFRDLPAQLRPVPLAHLEPDGTCRARPFRVWEREDRISARTRGHLRTTLGLEKQDKLVMLATAAWQLGKGIPHRQQVAPVLDGMPRILAHYLQQLPPRTHFLLAGEAPEVLADLPGNRIHRLPPCLPDRFGNLIGAADAVLSLNIAATTVTRAVMAGVPAMVLGNRFDIGDPADAEQAEAEIGGFSPAVRANLAGAMPLYPFRLWPLSFYKFLTPLLTGNPFTGAVTQAEILDEQAVTGGLTRLLYDQPTRSEALARQSAYADRVRALPDTPTVFNETLEHIGIGMVVT